MTRKAADQDRREFVRTGAMAISALATRRTWSAEPRKQKRKTKRLFDGKTLNGWIQSENDALKLSVGSILDRGAFTARLANGQDPVPVFLRGQFDDRVMTHLNTYAPTNANAAAQLSGVVMQVNQVLAGPSIFTSVRFRKIALRSETETLLRRNPRGEQLARLNKMLLEDAFPAEIAKSNPTGWIVKDGVMASTGAGRGVIYTAQDYSRYRLIYNVRHISGRPDHQAGVLIFCKRPAGDQVPLDALGGIQFQLPMGSYWDYRPGNNNSGAQFFTTINKSLFDRHAWSQVELLVNAEKGTARMAVAQPPGSKAIELVDFNDPAAGRTGPIAWQMHNAGLFDEYKDITIELDPEEDSLITAS